MNDKIIFLVVKKSTPIKRGIHPLWFPMFSWDSNHQSWSGWWCQTLWKILVNWNDDIPSIWENHPVMFQWPPTSKPHMQSNPHFVASGWTQWTPFLEHHRTQKCSQPRRFLLFPPPAGPAVWQWLLFTYHTLVQPGQVMEKSHVSHQTSSNPMTSPWNGWLTPI